MEKPLRESSIQLFLLFKLNPTDSSLCSSFVENKQRNKHEHGYNELNRALASSLETRAVFSCVNFGMVWFCIVLHFDWLKTSLVKFLNQKWNRNLP